MSRIAALRRAFPLVAVGSIGAGLLLWLTALNALPTQVYAMTLGADTPAITKLGPPPRLRPGSGIEEVVEGPVYFTVRSPRWYRTATIEVVYQSDGLLLTGMGGQVGEGFAYAVAEPVSVLQLPDGWHAATFVFDRSRLYSPRNATQFLLQTALVPDGHSLLRIRSITATLSR